MDNNQSDLRLLSKSAAAAKLGIGKSTLNKLIENGIIKVVFIYGKIKIPIKELNRFLDENTVPLSNFESRSKSHPRYRIRQTHPAKKERLIDGEHKTDLIFNKLKMEVLGGFGI